MLPGELGGDEGDFLAPRCNRRCGKGPWFAIGRVRGYGVTLQRRYDNNASLSLPVLQFEEMHPSLLLHLPILLDGKAPMGSKYLIQMRIVAVGQQYPIGRMASWKTRVISSLKSPCTPGSKSIAANTSARHFSPPAHPRLDCERMSGYGSPIRVCTSDD